MGHDPETVDSEYAKVQQAAGQLTQGIQDLATKLQAAASAGNADAREWLLDLKSLALSVQQEQLTVQGLLQAVHDFTVDHLSQPQQYAPPQQQYAQPAYAQPQYAPQPYYQQVPSGGGGVLSRFLGGGFGRAISTGAGFAIGDDLINSIF